MGVLLTAVHNTLAASHEGNRAEKSSFNGKITRYAISQCGGCAYAISFCKLFGFPINLQQEHLREKETVKRDGILVFDGIFVGGKLAAMNFEVMQSRSKKIRLLFP